MTFNCTNKNCYPDLPCALGHIDRTKCEHWKGEDTGKNDEKTVGLVEKVTFLGMDIR